MPSLPRNPCQPADWKNQVTEDVLAAAQHRREFPTEVTQFLQVNAQRAMDHFLFQNPGPLKAPGN
jgi:hypothetical protein